MLVSVAMITYNHEKYIKQAVESVLMQDCNFEIELIIADDESHDKTGDIITNIITSHPKANIIRYTKHKKNKGVQANFAWSIMQGKGKYVAVCEGDDYWTDPLKLQKQIDFLETNPDYVMACNASSEVDESGKEFKIAQIDKDTVDLAMVLREGWFIRTASIIFRKEAINDGFPDFFYNAYSTDYILQVMILKHGKCKYFPELMSAYRRHEGGISQSDKPLQLRRWLTKIKLLDTLNSFTDGQYINEIKRHQKRIKQTISFFLYRYPQLLRVLGLKTYIKRANLNFFLKEIVNRLHKKNKVSI